MTESYAKAPEISLRLYTNGTDLVIARDEEDADLVASTSHGYPDVAAYQADHGAGKFTPVPEYKLIQLGPKGEDEGKPIKAYPDYFIARFGRCYLGSTES
jgi:hypothetical protein